MAAFFGNNVFKNTCMVIMGLTLFFTLISFQQVEAGRPLGIELLLKKNNLVIQSLPRGSGGNPSPNPCTYIPGSSKGRCTLAENEANFGAHLQAGIAPPAFPEVVDHFAAASKENGTDRHDHPKKDQSSA